MTLGSANDISYQSQVEKNSRDSLVAAMRTTSIPEDQLLANLGLFIDSKAFSRLLFLNHTYQKIVTVPGVILDLGTRWGQNAAVFSTLRGIYEPFNRHRRIVCFDTFQGFLAIDDKDGQSELMTEGRLATSNCYQIELEKILRIHEDLNPLSHIKKFDVVPGDAVETLPEYLSANPYVIIALAYFDFDLYKPTKSALEAIRDRVTKGSVIIFDELNDPDSPGETVALMETFGLKNISLRRLSTTSRTSYFVVGT